MKKRSYSSYDNKPFKDPRKKVRVTRAYPSVTRFMPSGGELKFFDTAVDFTIDTTGEVPATGQLNLIPQGAGESQRIGRKVTIKSINFNGLVLYNPTTDTNGSDFVTIYLVLDKQCNGAAASATDVLTTVDFFKAQRNLANSERFVIMKRWQFSLQSQAGASGAFGKVQRGLKFYKKCNIPIEFSSTMGVISEIRSNNLFLLAGSTSVSDDKTAVSAICRLRYSD